MFTNCKRAANDVCSGSQHINEAHERPGDVGCQMQWLTTHYNEAHERPWVSDAVAKHTSGPVMLGFSCERTSVPVAFVINI